MPTLQVLPRPTPEEWATRPVSIDVEDALAELAETTEAWAEHRQNWEFTLQEGHEFGRANNVEGRPLFVSGHHTAANGLHIELFHILTYT